MMEVNCFAMRNKGMISNRGVGGSKRPQLFRWTNIFLVNGNTLKPDPNAGPSHLLAGTTTRRDC